MYGTGRGVPQDYAEAVRWHRLAAGQGNQRPGTSGSTTVGAYRRTTLKPSGGTACRAGPRPRPVQPRGHVRHRSGCAAGLRWPLVSLAAAQRQRPAQSVRTGRGVPQDTLKPSGGIAWPPSRATPRPTFSGSCTGRGVPQDYAEAVRWYRLARAKQGNAIAQSNPCTRPVGVCRRTTLKPSGGTAWPPGRANAIAQATSSCTAPVVCRRTTLKPSGGIACQAGPRPRPVQPRGHVFRSWRAARLRYRTHVAKPCRRGRPRECISKGPRAVAASIREQIAEAQARAREWANQ